MEAAIVLVALLATSDDHQWTTARDSRNGSHHLLYAPPESEADFAMTCPPGGGSITVTATAPLHPRELRLSSGGWRATLPATSEYDGEVFEGFTVLAQLPSRHRLLSAFASGRELRVDGFGRMPAETKAERVAIAGFVRTCRKKATR